MNNIDIIEINPFFTQSSNLYATSQDIDRPLHLGDFLKGKYRVFKYISNKTEENIEGSIFIIHENFVPLSLTNLPLCKWEESSSLNEEDGIVKIFNKDVDLNRKKLHEQLSDNMAQVTDNVICFSMFASDYEFAYHELKQGNHIVGLRIDEAGCWLNTANNLFVQACKEGNLEKVRYYLHSQELSKNASIQVRDYAGFYYASLNVHTEIITYLLCSSELTEHCQIKHFRRQTNFLDICEKNLNFVKSLILELPQNKFIEIKEVIEAINLNQKNLYHTGVKYIPLLLSFIEKREFNDQLNMTLSEKIFQNHQTKI